MTYLEKLMNAVAALEDVRHDKETKCGSEFDLGLASCAWLLYSMAEDFGFVYDVDKLFQNKKF